MPRPRLNLDIFTHTQPVRQDPGTKANITFDREAPKQKAGENAGSSAAETDSKENIRETPRFIPVGFHQQHLILLDEAVLKLRRNGQYQASKSAIIRNLIELHAGELDRIGQHKQSDGAD